MRSRLVMILAAVGTVLLLATVAMVAVAATDSDDDSDTKSAQQEGTNDQSQDDEGTNEAWLGVSVHPAEGTDGLFVEAVVEDGPADKAGIEQGDVITAIDGTDVTTVAGLKDAIDAKAVGDEVTLKVVKEDAENGATEDVKVTLGERPSPADVKEDIKAEIGEYFDRFLGGSFSYVNDDGDTVKVEVFPGTVTSVSDSEIKLDINGDEGEKTFSLPDGIDVSDLAVGDRAAVVTENGDVSKVLSGHLPLLPFGLFGGEGSGLPFGEGGFPMPFDGGGIFPHIEPREPAPATPEA